MLSTITETPTMIARLTLLFVVLAFASGNPAAGKPWTWKSPRPRVSPADPGKSSRIVGGNEATAHSHPYYVALYIDNMYFCSGSLISTEWVLTAAHCIDGARFVDVVLGAHNLQENEDSQVTMTSTDYVVHEDFNAFAFMNDIAVIRLPDSVTLNADIGIVGLPSTDVEVGTTVTAIGWGKESDSATDYSDVLREVDLTVISNTDCNAVYTLITGGEVCTDGSGGKGTCNGDEGGPLLQSGLTYGISSYETLGGCEEGNPDVFTRVYRYLDWIADQTGVTP